MLSFLTLVPQHAVPIDRYLVRHHGTGGAHSGAISLFSIDVLGVADRSSLGKPKPAASSVAVHIGQGVYSLCQYEIQSTKQQQQLSRQ